VPKSTVHVFRVTSRSTNLAYKGPVYEKTAAGTLVPFTPPAGPAAATPSVTAASAAASSTGASVAGGAAPGSGTGVAPVNALMPTALTGPTPRPELLVPGNTARYIDGIAAAPMAAPPAVQQIIWAGNELVGLPYIYGGGHASFVSPGYDCSGTVSFALHGGDLLATPEDSSEMMVTGSHGPGRWIAVFSNPGHAYMTVAGLRLDTSSADDPSNQQGPRWRPLRPANTGFTVRHPLGY
jgi:cell wall-associated NlpC family hydrolase